MHGILIGLGLKFLVALRRMSTTATHVCRMPLILAAPLGLTKSTVPEVVHRNALGMTFGVVQALGGLGLFLLGMTIMTGALRSLADEKLRESLAKTVNSPGKGVVTGAISTAILQSSSATTVAAVGFVGAGLLTFPESLGIIFGANIGTTITGWLVALVGFKLRLGEILLPLILLGVMLRFTGRPKLDQIGTAIAGFGLIFVGIGILQQGMSAFQGHVTPQSFPPDTVFGRLLLVLIGLVITLITQSSSAGVATALAAVHTGTISLNQAAAMVIGMDIGTSVTAAIATIGGNVYARRTGFAHGIYNGLTGIAAFLMLTPYMTTVEKLLPGVTATEPELVLVGFHTFFNTFGVLAALPFTDRFGKLVIQLIPTRGNPLTQELGSSLVHSPSAALTAVRSTLWRINSVLLEQLQKQLQPKPPRPDAQLLDEISDAIRQTADYLQSLSPQLENERQVREYVELLHVLDHLRRIQTRVHEERRLKLCRSDEQLSQMSDCLCAEIGLLIGKGQQLTADEIERIQTMNHQMQKAMRQYRTHILQASSADSLTTSDAIRRMDTGRTLRRLGYHIWRIARHLPKLSLG